MSLKQQANKQTKNVENKQPKSPKSESSPLTIEEEFQKLETHEHVLLNPDMYVGSMVPDEMKMDVIDRKTNKIVNKLIEYVPGLYKIFDEVIVNARDQSIKDNTLKEIRVVINQADGSISVYNDGNKCLPIEKHADWDAYVPDVLFSNFMASGNFHRQNKTIGAKNGYGVKLTSVMSVKSEVEVVNANTKKKFIMTLKNNMYEKDVKVIENLKGKLQSYVKFTFTPDYKKFGLDGMTDDMMNLFIKRVYDIAAVTNVNVFLNDEKININGFDDYIKMFYDDDAHPFIYDTINERWKVGVVFDPSHGFRQVSYVNGICTFQGGSHVNHVVESVVSKLFAMISEKNKNIKIKSSIVKDNLTFFIDCVIDEPSFNSQTKELLGSKVASFGSRCVISDEFIKLLSKTGIMDEVVRMSKAKEQSELKNNNGKKKANLNDYPKLNDAKNAGTRYAKDCTLILTEGDSAKPFGVAGSQVLGQENYGVFPLKGKLLNVRTATMKQLRENEEIKAIVNIMGLKYDTKYEDVNTLRYGRILVLTDQDLDGYHIKGLVMNFIEYHWPSLANIDGFITSMKTPLMKVWKNTDTKKRDPINFYSIQEYEAWKEITNNIRSYTDPKYYKGLGTSVEKEAAEAFKDFATRQIFYGKSENKDDTKVLKTVFSGEKEAVKFKKEWLQNYDKNVVIDTNEQFVSYTDFVNKELIHFSNHDNERSIPDVVDGLKPSIKKILFTAFKKGLLNKEVRVSELAGFVIGSADYHHGEMSLQGAIVGMAQNFVGSNNINWLMPNGQFGTRSGSPASSARYIHTRLIALAELVFRKEDACVLKYSSDDNGKRVEPEKYAPVICNVLVNGFRGIGTGFSTLGPSYNPLDIIKNQRLLIGGKQLEEMIPWYNGFKGKIIKNICKNGKISYDSIGLYEVVNENTIIIEELPVGYWTDNYKEFLGTITCDDNDKLQPCHLLKSWDDKCGNNAIHLTLNFHDDKLHGLIKNNSIETKLDLIRKINISNMYLYDVNKKLKIYENVEEIITEYYDFRLDMYVKRKEYYTKVLENKINLILWKIKFLEYYRDDKIIMNQGKKALTENEVIDQLIKHNFPKLSSDFEDLDKSYTYVTDIKLFDLTEERKQKLKEQYDKAVEEHKIYISTSVQDIWLMELDEIEIAYQKYLEDRDDDDLVPKGKGKGKAKKQIKKKNVK